MLFRFALKTRYLPWYVIEPSTKWKKPLIERVIRVRMLSIKIK
jgi:hypothetical protein